MTTILTRAAAWCANRLPARMAPLWPVAVIETAIEQMHAGESRTVAIARTRLVMAELRHRLARLELDQ